MTPSAIAQVMYLADQDSSGTIDFDEHAPHGSNTCTVAALIVARKSFCDCLAPFARRFRKIFLVLAKMQKEKNQA